MLDLAVGQADDAGMCLPVLAGICLAIVDTYRVAVAPPVAPPAHSVVAASAGPS